MIFCTATYLFIKTPPPIQKKLCISYFYAVCVFDLHSSAGQRNWDICPPARISPGKSPLSHFAYYLAQLVWWVKAFAGNHGRHQKNTRCSLNYLKILSLSKKLEFRMVSDCDNIKDTKHDYEWKTSKGAILF